MIIWDFDPDLTGVFAEDRLDGNKTTNSFSLLLQFVTDVEGREHAEAGGPDGGQFVPKESGSGAISEAKEISEAWGKSVSKAMDTPGTGSYWMTSNGKYAPVKFHDDVFGPGGPKNPNPFRTFTEKTNAVRVVVKPKEFVLEIFQPTTKDQRESLATEASKKPSLVIGVRGPNGYNTTIQNVDYNSALKEIERADKAARGEALNRPKSADFLASETLQAAALKPTKATKTAGIALLAEDTGRVLMLQRALDKSSASGKWEFPGGHLEKGETHHEAAMREWSEETGIPFPTTGQWNDNHWISGDNKYMGLIYKIPHESDIQINRHPIHRTNNPDDPNKENIETIAWWSSEDIHDNPALRQEAHSTPWHLMADASNSFTALLKFENNYPRQEGGRFGPGPESDTIGETTTQFPADDAIRGNPKWAPNEQSKWFSKVSSDELHAIQSYRGSDNWYMINAAVRGNLDQVQPQNDSYWQAQKTDASKDAENLATAIQKAPETSPYLSYRGIRLPNEWDQNQTDKYLAENYQPGREVSMSQGGFQSASTRIETPLYVSSARTDQHQGVIFEIKATTKASLSNPLEQGETVFHPDTKFRVIKILPTVQFKEGRKTTNRTVVQVEEV